MVDVAKEIWQTMYTNKLRTFLTGFSVSWGVFMLILLLAIARGVVHVSQSFAVGNNPYRISVWGGRAYMPYQGLKEGREIELRDRNLASIRAEDPTDISMVEGEISFKGTVSTQHNYSTESVLGAFPATFTARYVLVDGRFINQSDINEKRKSIVIHRNTAALLFSDTTHVVGQMVNLGSAAFKVVGVYNHDWNQDNYIPYSTARALQGFSDEVNSITVHIPDVKSVEESSEIEQAVIKALSKDLHFHPHDASAVSTYNRYEGYVQSIKATNILNYSMWVIGILTLVTGIVGVSNIMFVSVRERTHEIGIRRAIGAKPRSILFQVVLESVVLTTIFGYIGIVLGTALTEVVKVIFANAEFPFVPEVNLSIAVEVTVALIIAGALAGIFPALKSTKIKPVEALRDE